MDGTRGVTIWLFPIALTLHDLEEAIWLPAWSEHAGAVHPRVTALQFRLAVTAITLAGWALVWMERRRGGRWSSVLAGSCVVMMLNAVFPHLLATIALRDYAPGLATAWLFNVPVDGYLLARMVGPGKLTVKEVGLGFGLSAAVCAALIAAMFALGAVLAASGH